MKWHSTETGSSEKSLSVGLLRSLTWGTSNGDGYTLAHAYGSGFGDGVGIGQAYDSILDIVYTDGANCGYGDGNGSGRSSG